MKIYQMSEKKKRMYRAVGVFYILVFAVVLAVKPWHYRNPLYDILVYVFIVGLALCNLFRPYFCRLIITQQEIEFHNGLFDKKNISFQWLEWVEWSPETATKFYYKGMKRCVAQIPNIFSEKDKSEILQQIKRKKIRMIQTTKVKKDSSEQKGIIVNE